MANIAVVLSDTLSQEYDKRYVVIDKDTGDILDDAQGYGYKTAQKAHAAWAYKNTDASKKKANEKKRRHIRAWLKSHKEFAELMDTFAFEIAKGSWEPDTKFDAKFVQRMLNDNSLVTDFTASELLKVWKSGV